MADAEQVFSPGHGYIEQPSLLVKIVPPRRDALFRSRDEHDRELETLGRVEREKVDLLDLS